MAASHSTATCVYKKVYTIVTPNLIVLLHPTRYYSEADCNYFGLVLIPFDTIWWIPVPEMRGEVVHLHQYREGHAGRVSWDHVWPENGALEVTLTFYFQTNSILDGKNEHHGSFS